MPMRSLKITSHPFLIALAVAAVAGVAFMTYRTANRPPTEVLDFIKAHPNAPEPELVGSGMSPALACVFVGLPIAGIAISVLLWMRRR
jgi:hypothetical protein